MTVNTKYSRKTIAAALLACTAVLAAQSALATCYVDGVSKTSPVVVGSPGSGMTDGPCGHTVYGSSGCELRLDVDWQTSTAGNCLTLGKGVTFNMDGFSLECTATSCGKAIRLSSASGSGASTVSTGAITGCWTTAIESSSAVANSIESVAINLAGSGCQGGTGLFYPDTTYAVSVQNADVCVDLGTFSHLSDASVHDCDVGIRFAAASGSGNQPTVDNVAVIETATAAFKMASGTTHDLKLQKSTVFYSGCLCQNSSGTCQGSIDDCVDFNGVTPSIVGDDIR